MHTSDKRILKLLVVQTQNKTIPVLTVAIHSLQEPTSRKYVETSGRKAADEVNMQLCGQSIGLTMIYGDDVTQHHAVLIQDSRTYERLLANESPVRGEVHQFTNYRFATILLSVARCILLFCNVSRPRFLLC